MDNNGKSEVDELRKAWFRYFRGWQYMNWIMLAFISGGSAIVASSILRESPLRDVLALIVAIFSGIYTVINPRQRADAYRGAWIILNIDHLRNLGVSADTLKAVETGEAIIGRRAVPTTVAAPDSWKAGTGGPKS